MVPIRIRFPLTVVWKERPMVATAAPRAKFSNFRSGGKGRKPSGPKPEPKILFQQFFKSVGPRTYAAQMKQAANGNHFLVLTEGKRDEKTNELRMSRVFVYSEDFVEFFRLIQSTAVWAKAHPVDPKVKAQRAKIWAKKDGGVETAAVPSASTDAPVNAEEPAE
jgi:hypothetical protein